MPRSHHDRASIVILDLGRPSSDLVEAIPRQKLHDRGSIALRSRFDRAAIVEFFHENLHRPMERQESGRPDRDQTVSKFDDDPTLLVSPRGIR